MTSKRLRLLIQTPVMATLRLYRLAISPLLGPRCRFHPSCSRYMEAAVRRYGVLRGVWLGIGRLSACAPWHPGGVDAVPRDWPGWRRGWTDRYAAPAANQACGCEPATQAVEPPAAMSDKKTDMMVTSG